MSWQGKCFIQKYVSRSMKVLGIDNVVKKLHSTLCFLSEKKFITIVKIKNLMYLKNN